MNLSTDTHKGFQLTCQKIHSETHNVKTFIFSYPKSATNSVFKYIAGQHLSFTLKIKGVIHHCCYTLSSSPTNQDFVSITIKRIPLGTVSNYFHDHFTLGQSIICQNARGNFYLPEPVPEKVLLLSAGSGITPMISMLRFMVETQCNNEIVFMHSSQQENDLISKSEITKLARAHGHCQVIYTLTQETNIHWRGLQGRLNESMLHNIQQISYYHTFVCGPKSFRKTAQQILKKIGLPRNNYHYESFGEHEYTRQKPSIPHDSIPHDKTTTSEITNIHMNQQNNKNKISIIFSRWNKKHQGNTDQLLLEQGENAGLILPYSCRGGSCGSCKAILKSGQVHQHSSNGLSDNEKVEGYILLCSCTPLTDVVISHE